jgi:hypothetical protein
MKKYFASTPTAEVGGQTILGYTNCLQAAEIEPILARHNLHDVVPEGWYPLQMMLDVLHDIADSQQNVSESLVSIGIKVMELIDLPPSINSIETVLNSLGAVYHIYHRNVTEVGWTIKTLGRGHLQVAHDGPYPDDLCYGIVWGGVKRFKPQSATFQVKPVLSASPDDPCVFDVEWNSAN